MNTLYKALLFSLLYIICQVCGKPLGVVVWHGMGKPSLHILFPVYMYSVLDCTGTYATILVYM